MNCPECQSDQNGVLDSRPIYRQTTIWRRRKCFKCENRWTTYEVAISPQNQADPIFKLIAAQMMASVSSLLEQMRVIEREYVVESELHSDYWQTKREARNSHKEAQRYFEGVIQ